MVGRLAEPDHGATKLCHFVGVYSERERGGRRGMVEAFYKEKKKNKNNTLTN